MTSRNGRYRTNPGRTIVVLCASVLKMLALLVMGALMLRFALLSIGSYPATPEYLQDWSAIITGKLLFDSATGAVHWASYATSLAYTCQMVLIGLICSIVISLILGYNLASKPHSGYWDTFANLFTLSSGFPLFVMGLLASTWFRGQTAIAEEDTMYVILNLAAGGLILGFCEGALGDWPRNFRAIFSGLQEKTYFLAYRARGQNPVGLAYRTIRPYLWQSLATRISYLFGGVIIVEFALNFQTGLGYQFIDSIRHNGRQLAYREAMVAGILIMFVPIAVRTLIATRAKLRSVLPSRA